MKHQVNTIRRFSCKVMFLAVALTIALVGCANSVKSINQVYWGGKPSKEVAMAKINVFLSTHLIDPYSAMVGCSEPTNEAWIWSGVGYNTQYGYLVICQVNAKNRMGGYVGAERDLLPSSHTI